MLVRRISALQGYWILVYLDLLQKEQGQASGAAEDLRTKCLTRNWDLDKAQIKTS